MSGLIFQRSDGIVWRALSDRVLVHRVGATPDLAAAELSGPVVMVWLALDEPASVPEIRRRLAEASVTVDNPRPNSTGSSAPDWSRRAILAPMTTRRRSSGASPCTTPRCSLSASPPLDAELRPSFLDLLVDVDGQPTVDDVDHRLDVELAGDVWTVQWDGVASYVGPSIDLALYDSLIVLNHHAAATATASGRTVLHGGAVDIAGHARSSSWVTAVPASPR